MELLVSSVWEYLSDLNKVRVISIFADSREIILYPLDSDRKKISKPYFEDLNFFESLVQNGSLIKSQFLSPPIMLHPDENLTAEIIKTRDQRYSLIKDLIKNDNFILEFAGSSRSKITAQHARHLGVPVQTIYRILKDYFRYGMTINALIPLRSNQGGAGKQKTAGDTKRGRPAPESRFGFENDEGINITKEDKAKIKSGYIEFYANEKSLSLPKAHSDTLCKYYAAEIDQSKPLPTLRQFIYWGEILVDKIKVNKSRKPKGDFERNQRGLLKSVHASSNIPGKVFEIDATPADAHIVSPLNRNICIGRPTIYSITDRGSRIIAGFYVCLDEPSWEAARLAILHAFSPKVEYAKRYGIDISDEDWPCYHVPETLMGDRGEMKGKLPGAILPTLGVSLELAPAYRPDFKSIVEGRFKIINEESLHKLPGTTKGKFRERVEIDPRQEAVLTLDEITAILIRDVIKHNNFHQFDDLITEDLIKENLAPTPLNFWNYHITNHRHCLQKKSVPEIKALLLPTVQATVTKYGIKYEEFYYTCDVAEIENWYALARAGKEWKIDAKFDKSHIQEIYIRANKYSDYIVCKMTPRSKVYKSLHYADVLYMAEWKKNKKSESKKQVAEKQNFEARNAIVNNAIEEQKGHIQHKSKGAKIKDIRGNRRIEKERLSNIKADSITVLEFPTPKKSESEPQNLDSSLFENLWED